MLPYLYIYLYFSCTVCTFSLRYKIGTCKASKFDSNQTIPIRKWRADSKFSTAASAVVPQTALTVQQKNFNRCAVVIQILLYFTSCTLCLWFLRASAMLKHVIGRLSVRLSVTRWYCIKSAERIVIISLPHHSLFILVLCVSRSLRNSQRGHPPRGR